MIVTGGLVLVLVSSTLATFGYDSFSHGLHHITTESFSEGPCIKPKVAKEIDFEWLMKPRTFFIPIASEFSFRRQAEVYLSHPVGSSAELQNICQTVEWQEQTEDESYNATSNGFGNEFYMKCKMEERGVMLCRTRGGSPGTNPSKVSKTEEYVTDTDNKHYVIIVRCVDDLYKDYQVLTTAPEVPPKVFQKIADHIYDLGFNPRKIAYHPSSACIPASEYLALPKLGWPREASESPPIRRRPIVVPRLTYYPYSPFYPF